MSNKTQKENNPQKPPVKKVSLKHFGPIKDLNYFDLGYKIN